MAVINGTPLADFIHRNGDGFTPGALNEIATVTTGADTISGQAGNDVVFADAGNDTVNGNDGNDTLHGGQGTDTLNGGVGNDTFRIMQISDIDGLAETIDGGNDIDTLDFQVFGAFGAVNISLATITSVEQLFVQGNDLTLTSAQLGAFTAIGGTGLTERLILSNGGTVNLAGASINAIEEIRGNNQANTLILTGVANGQFINTLGGVDVVTGSDGNDIVDAGSSADTIDGGLGNDQLSGGSEADTLNGEDGNDVLTGGAGIDILTGGTGNDSFRIALVGDISNLAEQIDGGDDIDALDFQALAASGIANISAATITSVERLLVSGTELRLTSAQLGGFIEISGTGLIDTLVLTNGGTADLTGAAISGIEEIRGSAVTNIINLTDVANAQTIDGRAGDDTITGTLGNDLIIGGEGDDTLTGGSGNDTIRGNEGADRLAGSSGNDVFQMTGVSDIDGLDERINGGGDSDTLDFQAFGAVGIADLSLAVFVSLENLRLNGNTVTMTASQIGGFQTISGTGLIEIIKLGAAGVVNLSNSAVSGIDEFQGTSGNDTFNFTNSAGNQVIRTFAGEDTVTGGNGNDLIDGGDGNDTLSGGSGSDTFTGGLGKDNLTGGLGADTFDFNNLAELGLAATRDTITDFVHGEDIINLGDIDANTEVAGNQAFIFKGAAVFDNTAGALRYAGGILSMDVNGDNIADYQIAITGAPVLTVTDFVL